MLSAQQESRLIGYLDQAFLRHTSHSNKLTKLPLLEELLTKLEATINFLQSIPASESSIHIAYLLQLTALLPQTLVNYSPPTPVTPLFDFLALLDASWAGVLANSTQTDRIRLRSLLEEVERALREHLGITRRAGRANVGGEVVEPKFESLPRLDEVDGMEIDEDGAEILPSEVRRDVLESMSQDHEAIPSLAATNTVDSDSETEFDAVTIPSPSAYSPAAYSPTTTHDAGEPSFSINLGPAPPPPLLSSAQAGDPTTGSTELPTRIEREPDYDDNPISSRAGKIIDGDASDSESEDEGHNAGDDGEDDGEESDAEEDLDGRAIMVGLENLFSGTCRALESLESR